MQVCAYAVLLRIDHTNSKVEVSDAGGRSTDDDPKAVDVLLKFLNVGGFLWNYPETYDVSDISWMISRRMPRSSKWQKSAESKNPRVKLEHHGYPKQQRIRYRGRQGSHKVPVRCVV
jgi:hypothetical protein